MTALSYHSSNLSLIALEGMRLPVQTSLIVKYDESSEQMLKECFVSTAQVAVHYELIKNQENSVFLNVLIHL